MKAIKRLLSKQPAEEIVFTGNCPVRQRTADGVSVGRCEHSTYNNICPSHGNVGPWLMAPGTDDGRCRLDERDLPPYAERDFGSAAVRRKLCIPSGASTP